MPTEPVDQGCAAIQARVSQTSRCSSSVYSSRSTPSEDPLPRMSTRSEA